MKEVLKLSPTEKAVYDIIKRKKKVEQSELVDAVMQLNFNNRNSARVKTSYVLTSLEKKKLIKLLATRDSSRGIKKNTWCLNEKDTD